MSENWNLQVSVLLRGSCHALRTPLRDTLSILPKTAPSNELDRSAMALRAGSALLSANAVADRLRDRGRHFHLISDAPAEETTSSLKQRGGRQLDVVNGSKKVTAVTTSSTRQHAAENSHIQSSVSSQSSRVFLRFSIKPPTLSPELDFSEFNKNVHREWLKGRGCSWMPGIPSIEFAPESNIFHLKPNAPYSDAVPESGLAAALDTLEDAALEHCLVKHLTEGGDDRLHLSHPEAVNKYYCPPHPVSDTLAVRGSCTCSPPSDDGFDEARNLLRKLWQGQLTYQKSFDNIRLSISNVLACKTPFEIILHPSGSDAELIPLLVAGIRAKKLGCSCIVNIVVAAGEVGSGTAPAAGGRHFSQFTPSGNMVKNGSKLEGFPDVDVIELKARLADGTMASEFDGVVRNVINQVEKEHSLPFFIVHAVDGSKTGLRLPSHHAINSWQEKYGERILVVMDACQLRSESDELDWFLRRNSLVLITASKFYGAPGFCGAVLVPDDICAELRKSVSPAGLRDYLTQFEVPVCITGLHQTLPAGPPNIGLLLRWTCGVTEMSLYGRVGEAAKNAIRQWVEGVKALVRHRSPKLDLIDLHGRNDPEDVTRFGGLNSVISIRFLTSCGTRHLDSETLKTLHRLLTIDASAFLPSYASDEDRATASFKCLVGQPVKLGTYGVLRLAIGAVLARKIASTTHELEKVLEADRKILDKMIVLARYCEDLY